MALCDYIIQNYIVLQKCATKSQAQNEMYSLAISRFDIPGKGKLTFIWIKKDTFVKTGIYNQGCGSGSGFEKYGWIRIQCKIWSDTILV